MREILFRGKQIDTGAWLGGAFCMKDCDDPYGELVDRPSIIKYEEPHSGYWFRVDPETVGQFTGLTDKNGKKVFEGDIVKAYVIQNTGMKVRKYTETYVVAYHPKYCYFYLKRKGNNLLFDGNWAYGVFIEEVVCNIHDNPELLEV